MHFALDVNIEICGHLTKSHRDSRELCVPASANARLFILKMLILISVSVVCAAQCVFAFC